VSARTTGPSECSHRALARFAHKVDRQWIKGAPASMPKHWRAVCGLALAMEPRRGADPLFHRAVVASLRFALPHRAEQSTSIDVWARDPRNLAALAVDLLPVIRTHARGVK